jgi:hypothetical protein
MKISIVLISLVLLQGCATSHPKNSLPMSAHEAIFAAADAAPDGVPGLFSFTVQGAGADAWGVYLNSEVDYRDLRNLTISIPGRAVAAFVDVYGQDPRAFFMGKTVRVEGEARTVRIDFFCNAQPSGKYYYQTHIRIDDPRSIEVLTP